MKKNEFLIGFGLIVSFVIIVVLGVIFAPVPYHTEKFFSVVRNGTILLVYKNTNVVHNNGTVLSESKKLLRVEVLPLPFDAEEIPEPLTNFSSPSEIEDAIRTSPYCKLTDLNRQ